MLQNIINILLLRNKRYKILLIFYYYEINVTGKDGECLFDICSHLGD